MIGGSIHFQRLLAIGELLDSARGHGLRPTWPIHHSPAPDPPWLLATVLDHVLHSADLEIWRPCTALQVPMSVSDHLPVVVGPCVRIVVASS